MSHSGHSVMFLCSHGVTNENHHHYQSSIINMYSIKLVKEAEGICCSWYNIKPTKTKSVIWPLSSWVLNTACPLHDHNSFKFPVTWFTNFTGAEPVKTCIKFQWVLVTSGEVQISEWCGGRKMVQYMNCLQSPNWQPEHAVIIVLNSAMILTCKNQGFHYDSRERIKSWNSKSAPIFVVHILKNPVNSYDSNSAITLLISALGDEKWNLPFFCLPIFPLNPLNVLGHIILYVVGKTFSRRIQCHWNRGKRSRNDGEILETSFTNMNLGGRWSLDLWLSLLGACATTSSYFGWH